MRRGQRGTMLIIALIVLVAMTLAGIATMRSVDTASLVAGNVGFRQSTVNAADQGLQAGYAWLSANLGPGALYSSNPAAGYTAHVQGNGDPDWTQSSNWQSAVYLNGGLPDAAGNVVAYLIERLCSCDGPTNQPCSPPPQQCGSTPSNLTVSGEGNDQSQPNFFTLPPATHYRVTARAVGPHGAVAIAQTLMRIQ